MNITMLTTIIVSAVGALLVGMAVLIKSMVLGRLEEIQQTITGLSRDLHRMEIRLTKLESEHQIMGCFSKRAANDN